jgi:hypothetical protein
VALLIDLNCAIACCFLLDSHRVVFLDMSVWQSPHRFTTPSTLIVEFGSRCSKSANFWELNFAAGMSWVNGRGGEDKRKGKGGGGGTHFGTDSDVGVLAK